MKISYLYVSLLVCYSWILGCGGDSSKTPCDDSPLVGIYHLYDSSTLTFKSDCTWYSTKCETSGTFEDVKEKSGQVRVKFLVSTCHEVPYETTCSYAVSGIEFTYSCQ